MYVSSLPNLSKVLLLIPRSDSVLLRYTCPQTGGAIYCQTLLTEHVKFSKSEVSFLANPCAPY